jgi:hypothetical protein
MRSGGTSRGQYYSPFFERRSQERGTSTSRMTTASMRPPWRRTVCQPAHAEQDGECSQTTGFLPRLLLHSRPARKMLGR